MRKLVAVALIIHLGVCQAAKALVPAEEHETATQTFDGTESPKKNLQKIRDAVAFGAVMTPLFTGPLLTLEYSHIKYKVIPALNEDFCQKTASGMSVEPIVTKLTRNKNRLNWIRIYWKKEMLQSATKGAALSAMAAGAIMMLPESKKQKWALPVALATAASINVGWQFTFTGISGFSKLSFLLTLINAVIISTIVGPK